MTSPTGPVPGTTAERVCFEVVADLRTLIASGQLDRSRLHTAADLVVADLHRAHAEALASLPFLRTAAPERAPSTAASPWDEAVAIVQGLFGPLPAAIRDVETPLEDLSPAWQAVHLVADHLNLDPAPADDVAWPADRLRSAEDLAFRIWLESPEARRSRPRMLGGGDPTPHPDVVSDWLALSAVRGGPRPAALLRVDAAVAALGDLRRAPAERFQSVIDAIEALRQERVGPGALRAAVTLLESRMLEETRRLPSPSVSTAADLDAEAARILGPFLVRPLTAEQTLPEEARGAALATHVQALRRLGRAQANQQEQERLHDAGQGSSNDSARNASRHELREAERTAAATQRLLRRLRLALPAPAVPDRTRPGLYGGSGIDQDERGAVTGPDPVPAASFGAQPRSAVAPPPEADADTSDRLPDPLTIGLAKDGGSFDLSVLRSLNKRPAAGENEAEDRAFEEATALVQQHRGRLPLAVREPGSAVESLPLAWQAVHLVAAYLRQSPDPDRSRAQELARHLSALLPPLDRAPLRGGTRPDGAPDVIRDWIALSELPDTPRSGALQRIDAAVRALNGPQPPAAARLQDVLTAIAALRGQRGNHGAADGTVTRLEARVMDELRRLDPSPASATDLRRVHYAAAALDFERRLGHYLSERPKSVRTARQLAQLVFKLVEATAPERLPLLGTTEPTTVGAVGVDVKALRLVTHEGNLRETISLASSAYLNGALANLIPTSRRLAEVKTERRLRVSRLNNPPRTWETPDAVRPELSPAEQQTVVEVDPSTRQKALRWVRAEDVHSLPLSTDTQLQGEATGGLVSTGLSGSAPLLLNVARSVEQALADVLDPQALGAPLDFQELRLALLGFFVSAGHHTFHELMLTMELWERTVFEETWFEALAQVGVDQATGETWTGIIATERLGGEYFHRLRQPSDNPQSPLDEILNDLRGYLGIDEEDEDDAEEDQQLQAVIAVLRQAPGFHFGFAYTDGWGRYRNFGLSEGELRRHVAVDGLFPDEIALGGIRNPEADDVPAASGHELLNALRLDPASWASALDAAALGRPNEDETIMDEGFPISRLDAWSRLWRARQEFQSAHDEQTQAPTQQQVAAQSRLQLAETQMQLWGIAPEQLTPLWDHWLSQATSAAVQRARAEQDVPADLVAAAGLDDEAARLLSPYLARAVTTGEHLPDEVVRAARDSHVRTLHALHQARTHHRQAQYLHNSNQGSSNDFTWNHAVEGLRQAEQAVAASRRLLAHLHLALPQNIASDHPGLPAGGTLDAVAEPWGSGEVVTDRWQAFGEPAAFEYVPGRTGDPGRPDTAPAVRRLPASGERTMVGYAWSWSRDGILTLRQRIHLDAVGVPSGEIQVLMEGVREALDRMVNSRAHRLGSLADLPVPGTPEEGPLLRLEVEFTDAPEDAHLSVRLLPGVPSSTWAVDQGVWHALMNPDAVLHELLHGYGVRDDKKPPQAALRPGRASGAPPADVPHALVSVMGVSLPARARPGLPGRHLLPGHVEQVAATFRPHAHAGSHVARSRQTGDQAPGTRGPEDRAPRVDLDLVHENDLEHLVLSSGDEILWRFSEADPEQVFASGFEADDLTEPVPLTAYVANNLPAPFVSTTGDPELWFGRKRYRFEIDASRNEDPIGIDVNAIFTALHKHSFEQEIAFTGRIAAEAVVSVYDRELDLTGVRGTGSGIDWTPGDHQSRPEFLPDVEEQLRQGDRFNRTGAALPVSAPENEHGNRVRVHLVSTHDNGTRTADVWFLEGDTAPTAPKADFPWHWQLHQDGRNVLFPVSWSPARALDAVREARANGVGQEVRPGVVRWHGESDDGVRIEGVTKRGTHRKFRPTRVQPLRYWPTEPPVGHSRPTNPFDASPGLRVESLIFMSGDKALRVTLDVHDSGPAGSAPAPQRLQLWQQQLDATVNALPRATRGRLFRIVLHASTDRTAVDPAAMDPAAVPADTASLLLALSLPAFLAETGPERDAWVADLSAAVADAEWQAMPGVNDDDELEEALDASEFTSTLAVDDQALEEEFDGGTETLLSREPRNWQNFLSREVRQQWLAQDGLPEDWEDQDAVYAAYAATLRPDLVRASPDGVGELRYRSLGGARIAVTVDDSRVVQVGLVDETAWQALTSTAAHGADVDDVPPGLPDAWAAAHHQDHDQEQQHDHGAEGADLVSEPEALGLSLNERRQLFEQAVGVHYFHDPAVLDTTRASVRRLRTFLHAAYPDRDEEQIASAFFTTDPTSAGQVDPAHHASALATLDLLLTEGNPRELLTAFANAVGKKGYVEKDPDVPSFSSVTLALLRDWSDADRRRAEELGLSTAVLDQYAAFLRGPRAAQERARVAGDPALSSMAGLLSENDLFALGSLTAAFGGGRSDLNTMLRSEASRVLRPPTELLRAKRSPSDYHALGVPLSQRERDFLARYEPELDVVGARLVVLDPGSLPVEPHTGEPDLSGLLAQPDVLGAEFRPGDAERPARLLVLRRETYPFRPRAHDLPPGAAGPEFKLGWVEGRAAYTLDEDSRWYRLWHEERNLPVVAGVSGTAMRMLTAVRILGVPGVTAADTRKALFGWMLPGPDHSLAEIIAGALFVGAGQEGEREALRQGPDALYALPGLVPAHLAAPLGDAVEADAGPGEVLGSGEVNTDRWLPLDGRLAPGGEGEEPFVLTSREDFTGTEDVPAFGVRRGRRSGLRNSVGYQWIWTRDGSEEHLVLTRRIRLLPMDGLGAAALARVRAALLRAVQRLNTVEHRLPPLSPGSDAGPRVHFAVRFPDSDDVHSVVRVRNGRPGEPGTADAMNQMQWFVEADEDDLLRELLHGYGPWDDDASPMALLHPVRDRAGQPVQDRAVLVDSLMGGLRDPDSPRLLSAAHLDQIHAVLTPFVHRGAGPRPRLAPGRPGPADVAPENAADVGRRPAPLWQSADDRRTTAEQPLVLEDLLASDGSLERLRELAARVDAGDASAEREVQAAGERLAEQLPARGGGRVVLQLGDDTLSAVALPLVQRAATVLGSTVGLALLPGTVPIEVCPPV